MRGGGPALASLLGAASLGALLLGGCSSSGTPEATAEQKKAFGGSAPPANYMDGVNKSAEDAKKKAQEQHQP